jgi:hypothetical protein
MPYPHRDPGPNPETEMAFRLQPNGFFAVDHTEGRVPTEQEQKARWRREGAGGPGGVMRPIWAHVRNGMPPLRPYRRDDAQLATAAWQRVADIQARLRGEPAPAQVHKPWNQRPCPGCGYQMRCTCGPVP